MVALPELSLLFFRGRGDLPVRVAPKHAPNAWEDLPLLLSVIDDGFHRREFTSLQDVAAALKPRMKLLHEALSGERYPDLQKGLADAHAYDRAIIRQWETEINRAPYPDK